MAAFLMEFASFWANMYSFRGPPNRRPAKSKIRTSPMAVAVLPVCGWSPWRDCFGGARDGAVELRCDLPTYLESRVETWETPYLPIQIAVWG